jgi:COP9 signalosome complex subunit 6
MLMGPKTGGASGATPRVMGFIAGTVKGRTIEVLNSFEVTFTESAMNMAYFKERFAQCMSIFFVCLFACLLGTPTCAGVVHQVFPTYEVLGWYSTGATVEHGDIALHKQVTFVCSCLFFGGLLILKVGRLFL